MTGPTSNEVGASRSILHARGGSIGLLVDGEPFLVLGAELHNSSSGTAGSIRAAFAALEGRNVNTVQAAVSWAEIEPIEGRFDFSLVDTLLQEARAGSYRLILLWFGSWKNGLSTYVPSWVKRDQERFPRAMVTTPAGIKPIEHLSPFGEPAREADATAFARMMEHLQQVDSETGTVIMVQVENEVGLLGDSRDRSVAAEEVFASQVPQVVLSALADGSTLRVAQAWHDLGRPMKGNWTETLGDSEVTDEAFMALAYATYIEAVAKRGRAAHEIPLFVNAWLDSEFDLFGFAVTGGQHPGDYPSGGPLPHVAAIWRAAAPSIDLLTPDIYTGRTDLICQAFLAASGGLFVPETRRDAHGAALAFEAIGEYGALGVAPFGVDSFEPDEGQEVSDAYLLLTAIAPRLEDGHKDQAVRGFKVSGSRPEWRTRLGDIDFIVSQFARLGESPGEGLGYGIIIRLAADNFLVVGRGFRLEAHHADGRITGILRACELSPGDLSTTRVLNGDETRGGSAIVHPPLNFRNAGSFPIPMSTGSTGLTVVEYHAFGGSL